MSGVGYVVDWWRKWWWAGVAVAVCALMAANNRGEEEEEGKRANTQGSVEFPQFAAESKSLAKKHLTRAVFEQLKDERSPSGLSIADMVASGVVNADSGVGCYGADTDSFRQFGAFFEPLILDYHNAPALKEQPVDWSGDGVSGGNLGHGRVRSTRVRVGRNLAGFPLGAGITAEQRAEVEKLVVAALDSLEGDLAGKYYSLGGLTEEERAQLTADHFLFKRGDRFLEAARLNRDWPASRGIFFNHGKTFLVWLNEEDQLRLISMQKGGDVGEVFNRLARAVAALEKKLTFAHDKELGWIASCPSNLGTAMRASVHIELPKLAKHPEKFEALAAKHRLQIRGIHGEHSQSEGGVFDVSNKERLGLSETDCVRVLAEGVEALVAAEESGEF